MQTGQIKRGKIEIEYSSVSKINGQFRLLVAGNIQVNFFLFHINMYAITKKITNINSFRCLSNEIHQR